MDEQLKEAYENSTIGIILCAEKDQVEVEYALWGSTKPIGVVEYILTKELPKELSGMLPTAQELEEKLSAFE